MLSFLRARTPPTPPPRSLLRDLRWDGRALDATLDGVSSKIDIAIELDGSFFSIAASDENGHLRFDFPFAPQAAGVHAVLRCGRDGEALTPAPLRLQFGEPGLQREACTDSTRHSLAALSSPSCSVPFGIDVAAIEVAIVVPVYDAPDGVKTCLDAVLQHTTGNARLIVIDDASPNPGIAPLLARYAALPRVVVLANPTNRGFTATANRGIAEAGRADVVLLNADTQVGPNWLDGLRRAVYCADDVATATAVSDNAGAFSVPELERENALPACWTFDECARALWQHAGHAYAELPTGNGFCMAIRRSVVDAVGALDELAFPQGYGEENDFCQRASARGLRHLIAGNVLVRHARSQSFGHERRASLGVAGMAVLRERWPRYEIDVGASLHSYARRVLDWRVRRVFADAETMRRPAPRVLHVGGALPASLKPEGWYLRIDSQGAELHHSNTQIASTNSATGPAKDEQIWRWLQDYAIEAVITSNDASSLMHTAQALGIPVAKAHERDEAERAVAQAIAASRTFAGRVP